MKRINNKDSIILEISDQFTIIDQNQFEQLYKDESFEFNRYLVDFRKTKYLDINMIQILLSFQKYAINKNMSIQYFLDPSNAQLKDMMESNKDIKDNINPSKDSASLKPVLGSALIIDDDENVRKILSKILEADGYDVFTTETGMMGEKIFKTNRPDIIFLDVNLKDENGYLICQSLRLIESQNNKNRPRTPIIFLSGDTKDESIQLGIESGGDDYICKPITPKIISAKLLSAQRTLDLSWQKIRRMNALEELNNKYRESNNEIIKHKIMQDTLEKANHALEEEIKNHKITAASLIESKNQLLHAEKMASLGQLSAGVAHEINNPICYIMGNLKVFKEYILIFIAV